jgi:hypothetical protein
VTRKHSDLLWLQAQLQRLHPYRAVPVLKSYHRVTGDRREAADRGRAVEAFLQQVIEVPELFLTGLVEGFFRNEDQGKFDKYRQAI